MKIDLDPSETVNSSLSHCLNCGFPLTGYYCSNCGQKQPRRDPTLREFFRDATEELFQWDGKVPQTLKTLLLNPGLLTADFLSGRRARWLPPLRLYLICSLAFFISKPIVEAVTGRSAREIAQVTITNPEGNTALTPEQRKKISEGLPARIFGVERLERAAANAGKINKEIDEAFPKSMFLLLPFFALLTNIGWRKSWPRYPAHLYLALHLHAAWFLALTIAVIASAVLSSALAAGGAVAALVYIVWHALSALHQVFGEGWGRTIVKSIAICIVYSLSFSLVSILLLAYALMTV